MLRVPGTHGSLQDARTQGADVRMIYSPLDAIELAARNPARQVVLLAVGFETTAPATALTVLQAAHRDLKNFSVLAHHVRVEPAMRALLAQPACRIQAFLAAGHVCTVTGFSHYTELVREFRVPIVVTGFEPVDLLTGLQQCVRQLEQGEPALFNAYSRSVGPEGNAQGQSILNRVFQVATIPWRGFGLIPNGGLMLRPEFHRWDARVRCPGNSASSTDNQECLSGAVMSGQLKPTGCPLFGTICTPDSPRGAPMVSSEGACAAYFHYALPIKATT